MKICILSDSHDQIPLLDTAVEQARIVGAEAVIHCGDVVAPSTLQCLEKHGLPVHVIHGNNSGDLYALGRLAARPGGVIRYHGMDAAIDLGGRRVFVVHYPHYARAMALTGDWDLVCCGHSHRPQVSGVDNILGSRTLLVDPGTIGGVGGAPATYVIGDLEAMEFEILEIERALRYPATLGAAGTA